MPDNIVRVPKPALGSFNSKRPLAGNALLKNQVAHFREVEKALSPEQQSGIDSAAIATEGEAGDYIRKITAVLHPAGARVQKAGKA
jgi:hypothetical protein